MVDSTLIQRPPESGDTAFAIFSRLFGQVGNKLTVQAVRNEVSPTS